MVLILDIKSETPVMIHTIWLGSKVGPPSEKQDFIVQMDLDTDRNMLLCRSRFGIIFWVQLFHHGRTSNTKTMVSINSYSQSADKDFLSQFKWLSRMGCYAEGTQKGLIKIRSIENEGEVLLQLPTPPSGY